MVRMLYSAWHSTFTESMTGPPGVGEGWDVMSCAVSFQSGSTVKIAFLVTYATSWHCCDMIQNVTSNQIRGQIKTILIILL